MEAERNPRRPHAAIITSGGSEGFKGPARLGRHVKIAFGQAVNLVGPELDLALPPGQVQVRVMSLRLSDRSNLVDESQRLGEILERVEPFKMAVLIQLPAALQLLQHSFCLGS